MYGVYKLNSRMNYGNSVPLDVLNKISNDDTQSRISLTQDADKQINEICENCLLIEEVYFIYFIFIFKNTLIFEFAYAGIPYRSSISLVKPVMRL